MKNLSFHKRPASAKRASAKLHDPRLAAEAPTACSFSRQKWLPACALRAFDSLFGARRSLATGAFVGSFGGNTNNSARHGCEGPRKGENIRTATAYKSGQDVRRRYNWGCIYGVRKRPAF
jgi:hypothetical protein